MRPPQRVCLARKTKLRGIALVQYCTTSTSLCSTTSQRGGHGALQGTRYRTGRAAGTEGGKEHLGTGRGITVPAQRTAHSRPTLARASLQAAPHDPMPKNKVRTRRTRFLSRFGCDLHDPPAVTPRTFTCPDSRRQGSAGSRCRAPAQPGPCCRRGRASAASPSARSRLDFPPWLCHSLQTPN